jgi:hypothetical protein
LVRRTYGKLRLNADAYTGEAAVGSGNKPGVERGTFCIAVSMELSARRNRQ